MSKVMYKLPARWSNEVKIEAVEVTAQTKCYVTWVKTDWSGKKYENREQANGKFFDTFDEAKQSMMDAARAEVSRKEADWQRAKDRLQKINNLSQ